MSHDGFGFGWDNGGVWNTGSGWGEGAYSAAGSGVDDRGHGAGTGYGLRWIAKKLGGGVHDLPAPEVAQ